MLDWAGRCKNEALCKASGLGCRAYCFRLNCGARSWDRSEANFQMTGGPAGMLSAYIVFGFVCIALHQG